jgi:hypothetical protein
VAQASERHIFVHMKHLSGQMAEPRASVSERAVSNNAVARRIGIGAKANWLVWSVWTALVLAAAGYVIHFGSNVPYWDDWNMVDVITGAQPVTLEWLWSPYGGHRIPLPRLVLLTLYKLTGADFRAGMYFNVVVLAAAAAALIWASARMRGGRVSVTDAVFPLLLLHWGHFENLLWSWQVGFGMAVALLCAALGAIAAYGLAPVPKAGVVLVALGIVMLPISDVPGLVYTPPLACWLGITGMVAYRNHRRGYAALLLAAAGLALTLVVLYFQGYGHAPVPMSVAHWGAALRTSVGFVAGGFGPAGRKLWLPLVLRAVPAAVLLATFAALVWAAVRNNQPPFRSRALLLFFIGAACLVAAFGLGRTGAAAWVGRYFLLAVPMWCAAFLAWPLCLTPRLARAAQVGLLVVLVAAAPLNFRAGLLYARDYHGRMEQFHTDLLSGVPPAELVARHVASLDPCPFWGYPDVGLQLQWGDLGPMDDGFPVMDAVSFHDWIAERLRKLHAAKIGDYGRMQPDDPPVREFIPSPVSGFAVGRTLGGNGRTEAEDTAVLLTPNQPLYVAGIRVRRPLDSASSSPTDVHLDEAGRPTDLHPPWVQVFWRLPGESGYTVPHRYVFAWSAGKDEQIVWIFQMIDQIGFHMGNPDAQRRVGPDYLPVTLLLPTRSYAH